MAKTPDRSGQGNEEILVGKVRVTFARHIRQKQCDLLIKDGCIVHPPLQQQLDAINKEYGPYGRCDYQIVNLASRDVNPVSSREQIREVTAHLITPLGGRTIGTSEPIDLIFVAVKKPGRNASAPPSTYFLLFRRPTFGVPDTHSLFPIAGVVRKDAPKILISAPGLRDLLHGHGFANAVPCAGLPPHPSVKASQFETLRPIVLEWSVARRKFDQIQGDLSALRFSDDRKAILILAQDVVREIGQGRVSQDIIAPVVAYALSVSKALREEWRAYAAQRTSPEVPVTPNWLSNLEGLITKPSRDIS